MGNLSADALPQVLEIFPRLSEEDKAIVQEAINAQREELEESQKHWQSLNYSRAKALERLQKH